MHIKFICKSPPSDHEPHVRGKHHHCSFRSQDSGPKPGPEIQDRNIFFDPKMWDRDSVLNLETQIFSVLNSRTEALLTMKIFLGGGVKKFPWWKFTFFTIFTPWLERLFNLGWYFCVFGRITPILTMEKKWGRGVFFFSMAKNLSSVYFYLL